LAESHSMNIKSFLVEISPQQAGEAGPEGVPPLQRYRAAEGGVVGSGPAARLLLRR